MSIPIDPSVVNSPSWQASGIGSFLNINVTRNDLPVGRTKYEVMQFDGASSPTYWHTMRVDLGGAVLSFKELRTVL